LKQQKQDNQKHKKQQKETMTFSQQPGKDPFFQWQSIRRFWFPVFLFRPPKTKNIGFY